MNFSLRPNQPPVLNPQTPSSRHRRQGSASNEYSVPPQMAPQLAPKPPPRSRVTSRASIPPPMTPSYIPIPASPNLQSAAAATSLSTHEDSTQAPTRARSRAGSMYNEPLLNPTTGSRGGLYRHGSGSQSSLISNKTTASMRLKFEPSAYVSPAYNVEPPDVESELDLSGRAASPSRKAVSAHIGDAMTSVWKRPKKEKKVKK